MKEFIDKLIERLEEQHERCINGYGIVGGNAPAMEVKQCMDIVNELAEEYKDKNIITNFLQYVRDNADNYDADNGWSLSDLIDLSIKFCDEEEHKGGWIPCSEKQPPKPRFTEDTYLIQASDVITPYSAYWNGEYWSDVLDRKINNVIAWQPLPAAYKENERG